MDASNIYDNIINIKDKEVYTGIVSDLSPLTVKFYPDDDGIPVISTKNLTSLSVGSNVIMIKIGNKFVITDVIGAFYPTVKLAYKTDNQVISNSTTLTDDTALFLDLDPNGIYEVELVFVASGYASSDLKCDWTLTNVTPLSLRMRIGNATTTTSTSDNSHIATNRQYHNTALAYGVEASSNGTNIEKFICSTSSSTGHIHFRWCQNSASVENITVANGSYLKATRIG
jgi:hypothetical protein